MSSVSIYKMRKQLTENGVSWSEEDSPVVLREKFERLPITEGQISYLLHLRIRYDRKLGWTIGEASAFIKEAETYFRLRDMLPVAPEQKLLLLSKGIEVPKGMTAGDAARIISRLPAEAEQLEYIKVYGLKTDCSIPLDYGYCQYLIGNHQAALRYSKLRRNKKG